jgi:linoleoyl-CoA desaturase
LKKVVFNNKNNSFSEALNAEVKNYFTENNLKQTGDWRLYLKSIVLIPLALASYITLLTVTTPVIVSLFLCAVLGLCIASIGFNVMHDANHGSYSESKRINYIMGLTMNALGANAFIWKIKHNIVHHTYTNIDGMDDDIAKSPVLRHCYSQAYKPLHRYQHLYMFFFYGISYILWALYTDFDKYFKRSIHTTPINKIPMQEHILFWVSKVLYVIFYIALPIIMVGFSNYIIGYLFMCAVVGFTLSLVFQLAHVVEITEFVDATKNDDVRLSIEDSWAVHQMRTTANFATENKVVNWYVGGLNFQVEHHLFPKISHVHYPALSPIVQKVCKEFGVPYYNMPTMIGAIASHYRTMRKFGQEENPRMVNPTFAAA